jgi:hypothetical protein
MTITEENVDGQVKDDVRPTLQPTLNISQEVADVTEIDINDPSYDDKHISTDLAGNEKYFDCCVPDNYLVTYRGWWKIGTKMDRLSGKIVPTTELICRTRLMLTGKFTNTDTGADVAEITFVSGDKVETLLVPYVAILGAKEWKEHVRKDNYGRLDVLDEEIKEVSRLLREAAIYNLERISPHNPDPITKFKTGDASGRVGWNKNLINFIVGDTSYNNVDKKLKVSDAVFIDNRGVNVNQRLKPKGLAKIWFKTIKPFLKHHKLKFAMYYAIGSIFLAPLKSPNSAFGIIGDTSIGKTFFLQILASMFGNPNEKGEGLILNGNISITALNAILTSITDIPVFIDEITLMKTDVKRDLTYAIANGQEALRGNTDGDLRSSRMIRGNAIITGEFNLVDEFAHNGAAVRAFSSNGRPLPILDGRLIENTKQTLLDNYGHVLRLVLAKYYAMDQSKIKDWYDAAVDRIYKTTEDSVVRRKATYFAVAEVGGMLLEQVFKDYGMDTDVPSDIIDEAWNEFVLENPDEALEVKALDKVYKWALSKPRNFLVGDKQPLEDHPDDIFGWWVYPKLMTSGSNYEYLDLNKQEVDKFLRSSGYDKPVGILSYWRDHDITVCDTNSNGKKNKNGDKKLLTHAPYHYYQFNKKAERKGIIRVRMDKIKELIEIINTEEEKVIVGLQSLYDEEPPEDIMYDEEPPEDLLW